MLFLSHENSSVTAKWTSKPAFRRAQTALSLRDYGQGVRTQLSHGMDKTPRTMELER